jgi:hypothetical protein
MASKHSFFAHRLGRWDVDCEKGYGRGSSGTESAAKEDDVLSEPGRRRCDDSGRKHTWRRRRDDVSSPRSRSMTLPPNPFREPQTTTSSIRSSSPSSSASVPQAQQKAARASFTPCSPPRGAVCSLPVSREEQKAGHPHCGTSYSQEVAKLPIFNPVPQHILVAREDTKTNLSAFRCPTFPHAETHWRSSARYQAVPWAEHQNSAFSSFPNTFDLDQVFPHQGEEGVRK